MKILDIDELKKSEESAAIMLQMVIDNFVSNELAYKVVQNELLLDIEWWLEKRTERKNENIKRANKHMARTKDTSS
tara:strand:+ start:2174 stop:2401 length:228 start_codon:yes stop_codon:yes gene_type:complete